ncbi:MAG: ankyrin repeat domain-containing protein [Gammaproteobacteria bacterium]|nr:ankyrin repeat domain-containing protein [Gammaproteobacteria bacterium]
MIAFISENRGLLLLGAFASLGVLSFSWFVQPTPVIEVVPADEPVVELVESAPRTAPNIVRNQPEDSSIAVPPARPLSFGTATVRPEPNSSTNVELPDRTWDRNRNPTSSDLAEFAYGDEWEEFIGGMDLENEQAVRDVITAWLQYRGEVYEAWRMGEITVDELEENDLSIEDLQARLAPYMTSDQLADIAVNHEAYSDFVRGWAESMRAERDALGYYHPVIDAVRSGNLNNVRAALDAGADVNFETFDGEWTPLSDAVRIGNLEIAALLLDAGADIDRANDLGYTPLKSAVGNGMLEMVRLLISRGADLEVRGDDDGASPLILAAMNSETDIARELLRAGADATGKSGSDALAAARRAGNTEIQRMLRDAGAQ